MSDTAEGIRTKFKKSTAAGGKVEDYKKVFGPTVVFLGAKCMEHKKIFSDGNLPHLLKIHGLKHHPQKAYIQQLCTILEPFMSELCGTSGTAMRTALDQVLFKTSIRVLPGLDASQDSQVSKMLKDVKLLQSFKSIGALKAEIELADLESLSTGKQLTTPMLGALLGLLEREVEGIVLHPVLLLNTYAGEHKVPKIATISKKFVNEDVEVFVFRVAKDKNRPERDMVLLMDDGTAESNIAAKTGERA